MKKITTIFLTIIVLVTVLSSCTGLKTKEEDTPADHDTMLESDIITSNVNSSDKDSEQSRDIEDYVLYRNGGQLAYTKYDYDKYYKGCEDYAYYCEHQPKREEISEHNNGSLTIADIEKICRENEDFLNIFGYVTTNS